ncbi:MAG: TonB-dependent receptor [Methylocystaceae bacterium]|nr:TonB-dependent receptor [Methylocystaceae bacterium]
MFKNKLLLCASVCALSPFIIANAQAQVVLPEVLVESEADVTQRVILVFEEEDIFPIIDSGELLKSLPGVSGGRLGGHGLEPYIRGQKKSQINLSDDGAYLLGGCPNRMDPPSSYLQLEGNDELIVEKGYSSVTNGPGGSGGSVRSKRHAPTFTDEDKLLVGLSSGYNSNGKMRDLSVNTAVGFTNNGYVRGNGHWKKARDYKDGNNQIVRSGFESRSGRLDVGYSPTLSSNIKVGVQYDKAVDVRYSGGMDTPITENKTVRTELDHKLDGNVFDKMTASLYMSDVYHLMDSYSLRNGTMNMATEGDTRSYGGKFSLSGSTENNEYEFGVDAKIGNSDATSYMGTKNLDSNFISGYLWPDVTQTEVGFFGETTYSLSDQSRLKFGVRYDYVHVIADKVNKQSTRAGYGNRTANNLYNEAYGYGWSDQTEHNLGGLLRFDHDIQKDFNVYGSLSRVVRTADATERGIARNTSAMMASSRWYGNPEISPEKHYQIEFGTTLDKDKWSVGSSVYYDRVQDYILRDKARGQSGVLLSNGADIYRNVNATLTGIELSGSIDLNENWLLKANAAYTYGQNEEDNRPLAQIPPLEFGTSIEYSTADWMAAVQMRGSAKQNRADIETNNSSGLDVGETGGYAVFDMYGKIYSLKFAEVSLGMTNIFDKTYANHLNQPNGFDNTVTQVNEAGRSVFLRVNAKF